MNQTTTPQFEPPIPTYAGQDLPDWQILEFIHALTTKKSVKFHRRKDGGEWIVDVGPKTYSSPCFNHMVYSAAIDTFPRLKALVKGVAPQRVVTKNGSEHIHKTHGRVMVITCHPYDGASLIIQRMETTDPDDDDLVLDTCENSDLGPALPDKAWPFLGFTKSSE